MERLQRPRTTLRDKLIPKTKEQRDCLSTPPGGNWDAASFLSGKRENKTVRPRFAFKQRVVRFCLRADGLAETYENKRQVAKCAFFSVTGSLASAD